MIGAVLAAPLGALGSSARMPQIPFPQLTPCPLDGRIYLSL